MRMAVSRRRSRASSGPRAPEMGSERRCTCAGGAALWGCVPRGAALNRLAGGPSPSRAIAPRRPVPSGLSRGWGRAPQAPWRCDDAMARRCAEHPGSCSPDAAAICSASGSGRPSGPGTLGKVTAPKRQPNAAKEGREPAAGRVGACSHSRLVPVRSYRGVLKH